MQIHSSVGRVSTFKPQCSGYEQLDREFVNGGFTYKSNQILRKTSENHAGQYPYELILHIAKTFHFNQFEVVFFTHILNDVEPCYNTEPELFNQDIEISQPVSHIIQAVLQKQSGQLSYATQFEQFNLMLKNGVKQEHQEGFSYDDKHKSLFTAAELKRIYSYLLVLGYAVKYYLNEQIVIKPYDEEIKLRHPTFFASIFNRWAKKYGNTVLATTPRRINSYYLGLASQLQIQENLNNTNNEDNCQYRNYNEIVEELIKATTEGDEAPEYEKDPQEE